MTEIDRLDSEQCRVRSDGMETGHGLHWSMKQPQWSLTDSRLNDIFASLVQCSVYGRSVTSWVKRSNVRYNFNTWINITAAEYRKIFII